LITIPSNFHNCCLPLSNPAKDTKLKPDAPEFVPLQPSTLTDSTTRAVSKEAVKLQKKLEKEEQKVSLVKKTGKKTIKFVQPEGVCYHIAERREVTTNSLPQM